MTNTENSAMTANAIKPDSDDVSIKDVIYAVKDGLAFIFSKWLVITIAALIGALIGVSYSFIKKPVYAASSTFVLEESGSSGGLGLGQYSGLASMVGLDMGAGGGIFQGDNLLELYRSRTMLVKTLLSEVDSMGKRKKLVDIFIDNNDLRSKWDNKPELKKVDFNKVTTLSRTQDSLLSVFAKDINDDYLVVSKPDKKLNIIKVEIRSSNEFFAKSFNDLLVKNVNEFYKQTKTKKSMDNLNILQHQTDSIRTQLNSAISGVAIFLDANPNPNASRTQLRVPSQRRGVDVEANKAILTQLITNMELAKVTLRKDAPLIQLIDSPVFPLDKEHVGKVKGGIVGAIVLGFITAFIILIRKIIADILIRG